MLIGEYQHNIDAKGRLIMPAKFRADLGTQFVVTKGLDGCLFGYPIESWNKLKEKLNELPTGNKNARNVVRYFYSAATEVEIDKQGRINLSQKLIEHAGIDKECRVIGLSDRIEIWSSDRWEQFAEVSEENFEEIAESLMDFGF